MLCQFRSCRKISYAAITNKNPSAAKQIPVEQEHALPIQVLLNKQIHALPIQSLWSKQISVIRYIHPSTTEQIHALSIQLPPSKFMRY